MNNKLDEYLNQNIDNPKYLFHGSPEKINSITPHESYDVSDNSNNVDNAIFLFPSFLKATPYALKKAFNEKLENANQEDSYFETSLRTNEYPYATIVNRKINENAIGYIYVFENNDKMIKNKSNYQYRCFEELEPIDVIEIKYKDYKQYFKEINCVNNSNENNNINNEIKEDIEYYLKQAEENHIDFYFWHTKKELNEFISNYLKNNKVENKYDLVYMLNCINKYISGVYDAHTYANINNIWLPLDLKYIDNELYISNCFDDKFNHSKIISINGISIEKLIEEYKKCTSYGTIGHLQREIEIGFKNANRLLTLPSIINTNLFNYETDKGTLSIDTSEKYDVRGTKKDNYKIVNNTLIYRYKACNEDNVPNIEYVDKIIKEQNIDTFALDLRNNGGGNETCLYPFINYLKESNLKLYTIVDKGVFSAARWNVIDMKNIGSNIIGEDIGTPLNCFGSRNGLEPTPNFNINLTFSKWYIYYNKYSNSIETITNKEELHTKLKDFFEPIYLNIDEYVPLTKEDFLTNIDPIEEYFNNLNKFKKKR